MAGSGIDDFPKVDLETLREGMRRAAALGLPVAVHADSIAIRPRARGTGVADYLASRPIESECEAIRCDAGGLSRGDRVRAAHSFMSAADAARRWSSKAVRSGSM